MSALSKRSQLSLRGDRPNIYTEIGSSFLAQTMKSSFLKVGIISLLGGGRGCHGKEMSDYVQERDEPHRARRLLRGSNTEEVSKSKSVIMIASHQERSWEESMVLERRAELFGGGMRFKAAEVALAGPIHESKTVTNLRLLENPILFTTDTSKKEGVKDDNESHVATLPLPPTLAKGQKSPSKDQIQTLFLPTIELKIKGLAEFCDSMESEQFAEATTKHILSHWKNHRSVTIYEVWTFFVASIPVGQSGRKSDIKRNLQRCDNENTVAVQMQISVDFKSTDPKITKEFIITAAFRTGGDISYALALKESGVESFMCIVRSSEAVIIQPYSRTVQAQTSTEHTATTPTKHSLPLLQSVSDIQTFPESMVPQKSISQLLLAHSGVPSKDTSKGVYSSKHPRKLHSCTICTDNETP